MLFVATRSAFVVLLCLCLCLWTRVDALGNDLHNQVRIDCQVHSGAQFADLVALVEELQADLWDESPRAFPTTVALRAYGTQAKAFQARFACPHVSPLPAMQPVAAEKQFRLLQDFFVDYRSFAEQEAFLHELVRRSKGRAEVAVMGHSIEGRPLYVVQVSANPSANPSVSASAPKRAVWVNGGQHAREWLSPAACLYLLQTALEGDPELVRHFDLLVAPNLNPDGYEQSRTANRYWRKNKRVNRDGSIGVDLNRNWDFKWNQVNGGASTRSDLYPGTGPASEPEVLSTAAYILQHKHRIAAGIDVHTYGEVVLRNYGWTMAPCRDEAAFKRFGDAMAAAARSVAAEQYRSEPSAGLYPTSGSLDDWFYEQAGFPGFTFEMRDTGRYNFVTPPGYIVPNGKELVAAVKALMKELTGNTF